MNRTGGAGQRECVQCATLPSQILQVHPRSYSRGSPHPTPTRDHTWQVPPRWWEVLGCTYVSPAGASSLRGSPHTICSHSLTHSHTHSLCSPPVLTHCRCIHDGGKWYDCPGGPEVDDFVRSIWWVFICLPACLPVCLSVCLSFCLCVCLSICLSVCLSVCLIDSLMCKMAQRWMILCAQPGDQHTSCVRVPA